MKRLKRTFLIVVICFIIVLICNYCRTKILIDSKKVGNYEY